MALDGRWAMNKHNNQPKIRVHNGGDLGMVDAWVGQKLFKSNIFKSFPVDWLQFVDATICLNDAI